MRPSYTIYSLLKVTEGGGISQRQAVEQLRSLGLKCEPAQSPYVGHTAVIVYGGQRVQDRASRIIYGRA